MRPAYHSFAQKITPSRVLFPLIAIIFLISSAEVLPAPPPSPAGKQLSIFYNGSLRGDLGNMTGGVQAATVTLIEEMRKKHSDLFTLCAGDVIGPSATSNVDGGKTIIQIMNLSGYDVSGIGPHDFSYGWQNFVDRSREANFPFICSNIVTPDGGKNVIGDHVVIERAGKRLLVLGATSPLLPDRWPSWDQNITVEDPVASIEIFKALAETCDFVTVLSSMEFEENINLLKKVPWVHSIISTIVVGTKLIDLSFRDISLIDGRRLMWTFYSGKTTGFFTAEKGEKKVKINLELEEVADAYDDDERVKTLIQIIENKTAAEQSEHLSDLSTEESSNLFVAILNALRAELNAEVALIDESSLRIKEQYSSFTPHNLRKIYPFRSRGAVSKLTGKELKNLWAIRNDQIIWNQGLAFAGLREVRGKLLVNNRLIKDANIYRVATTEFLSLGSLKLLPKQPESVRTKLLADILIDHFRNNSIDERKRRYRAIENKTVVNRRIDMGLSYERLDFGGSASLYQYKDPSTFGIHSDIPGLVGKPHDSIKIKVDSEIVLQEPRADNTFRLDINYSTWDDSKSVDRAAFTIRRETTSIDSRPRLFGEYKLTGTLRPPDLSDQSHPMFGKAVGGMVWNLNSQSKVLAGLGHLSRFSQPGNPMSLGLNVQYELTTRFHKNIEFRLLLDGFASWEEERIRTGDLDAQFKFKITKHLSTVARYHRFLWNDSEADEGATRNEVFLGLSISRRLRSF